MQDIIKNNAAAPSGEPAAWEAEAEQPVSEEITPVSCIRQSEAEMFSFYMCLVLHKQTFTWLDAFKYVVTNMCKLVAL